MENMFKKEFWQTLVDAATDWLITSAPPILIVLVLMAVASIITGKIIKRLEPVIKKHIGGSRTEAEKKEIEKRVNTLMGIIRSVVKIVIITMGSLIILRKIGVDIGPLIAGAGIIGLAVGFGSQELVRDMITGFFMLLENQVRTGDVAIINGTGGLVEKIGLRTTVLRDLTGTVHIYQNGKINSLSNMTKDWSAMVFDIGVAYKENVDQVISIMKEVGEQLAQDPDFKEKINEPLEVMGLDKFGDSAVVIKARFKTKPIEQWSVGREYRRRLKEVFDERGIEIPFPHTTLYLGDDVQIPVKNVS